MTVAYRMHVKELKTQIKNCIVIYVLIILNSYSFLPVYASRETVTQLQQELLDFIQIQNELISSSKEAKPYARRMKYLAKRLNLLVLFTVPEKCKKSSAQLIVNIEKEIAKLENKKCQNESVELMSVTLPLNFSSRCISSEVLNNYLPLLNASFQNIKTISTTDEELNNLPDICESRGEQ